MRWGPVERELRSAGGFLLAGVDEVGRGPLAGPVVACAVIMRPDAATINGVADSKTVRADERARLATIILARAVAWGMGAASVREIDRLNIYHASTLAIRRAIQHLRARPHHILLDGRPIRALGVEHRAIVSGDATCYSIACASILAKVTRDRLMTSLGKRYPGYLWERNAGYSTAAHLAALASAGPTIHHRRSFGPVAMCITGRQARVVDDVNIEHDIGHGIGGYVGEGLVDESLNPVDNPPCSQLSRTPWPACEPHQSNS